MSEDLKAEGDSTNSRTPRVATVVAAGFVLVLAAAAILVPQLDRDRDDAILLVIDPLGSIRDETCYQPFSRWLDRAAEHPLRLVVVNELAELDPQDWSKVDLVFCPDGVALDLPDDRFAPLAVGRRQVPHNLRPRSVLVYRKTAGLLAQPWISRPERTILGDSLSLAGCGVMRQAEAVDQSSAITAPQQDGLSCGPDPYDHTPALHAMRLGCYDYAVVRDLAVEKFLKSGLLDPVEWGIENLGSPLPDVVLMVNRNCPAALRVRLGEILVGLGRRSSPLPSPEMEALAGLAHLELDGFNLLLENDFSQIRRQFDRQWPRSVK